MAIHRRPGNVPRSTVIDVEQPGVREDELPGCSVLFNLVNKLLSGTVPIAWRDWAAMSNTNVSAEVRKKIGNGFNGSPNKSTAIAKHERV
jgi:hypothetical protein